MSGETLLWIAIGMAGIGLLAAAAWVRRVARRPVRAGPPTRSPARNGMETLGEAIERLERRGYSDSFLADGRRLRARKAAEAFEPEQLRIDHVVRFEGTSDPGDESILFAIRDAEGRVKGTVATSFGPNADPALAELIQRIPDAHTTPRLHAVALAALLLSVALGIGPPARAWGEAASDVDRVVRIDGDMLSVDPSTRSFVVGTSDGAERFVWTERTRFVDARGEAEEADLAAGVTVGVQAMRPEGGAGGDEERRVVDVLRIIDPSELAAGVVISDLGDYPAFAVADTVTVIAYHPKTGVLAVETLTARAPSG